MGDYQLVRPLIIFTKKELEEYDDFYQVPYFIDQSNFKDKYTRNRYRKYVLPFLKTEEENVHLKFLKFSENLQEATSFIDKVTNQAIQRCIKDDKILISLFLQELTSY